MWNTTPPADHFNGTKSSEKVQPGIFSGYTLSKIACKVCEIIFLPKSFALFDIINDMKTERYLKYSPTRDVVFVLGAGASYGDGVPLQRDILPMLLDGSMENLEQSAMGRQVKEFIDANFHVDAKAGEFPKLGAVFVFLVYFIWRMCRSGITPMHGWTRHPRGWIERWLFERSGDPSKNSPKNCTVNKDGKKWNYRVLLRAGRVKGPISRRWIGWSNSVKTNFI
jgi:hypothetical protein